MIKFSISKQEIAQKWIEIFKIIKNLNSYTTIYTKNESLSIQIMDEGHVCLMNIEIEKEWFCFYECDNEEISFVSNIIVKILNLYVPNSVMIFETNKEKLQITFKYSDNSEKVFEIPLIDIDKELLESQEIEGSVEFEMETKVFDKYISEMLMFGDSMEFICYKDKLYMKTSGDEGNYLLKIPHSSLNELIVEEELKMKTQVTLKYIHFLSKTYNVFKVIKLKIQENIPFHIIIEEPKFCLYYYIAPKFCDDEDEKYNFDDLDNNSYDELENVVIM